jgi:bacterioferritin (cytochrome b1)
MSNEIQILNALLTGEIRSIFAYLHDAHPNLNRASAALRQPLENMIAANQRHAREMADRIEFLGAVPHVPPIPLEEQYLSFLSMEYLLPQLIEDKEDLIARCKKALAELSATDLESKTIIQQQLSEHESDALLLSSQGQMGSGKVAGSGNDQ